MKVCVIGVGADGYEALPDSDRQRIASADVVFGGDRHLRMLGPGPQARHAWPSPLRAGLESWPQQFAGREVVALASGDPLLAGVATTLVEVLGRDVVEVRPAVSSVALARARMRWSAESVTELRDHRELPRWLFDGHRVLILSEDEHTPATVAAALREQGFGASRITVLGDLGAEHESQFTVSAEAWTGGQVPRLNALAVELAGPGTGGLATGLDDEAFSHDGQLTRRDLRAAALARLAPTPGALLWDVGAGAGSVAIEWMRHHRSCHAVAIEADADRAARIRQNAERLGAPRLDVVEGRAPEALTGLAQPQAVFIGGGASQPGVVEACWSALAPGGRLVVHAVTAQTESRLVDMYERYGGELTRTHIEDAAPLGRFTGWTPRRAVTQWAVRR